MCDGQTDGRTDGRTDGLTACKTIIPSAKAEMTNNDVPCMLNVFNETIYQDTTPHYPFIYIVRVLIQVKHKFIVLNKVKMLLYFFM